MGKVRGSLWRHDIKPCAQIHDALYFLVRDDPSAMEYANFYVVEAVEWQRHPDIWHPVVKLGGTFSIFYPDWSQEIELPNYATSDEIGQVFKAHVEKFNLK